MRSPESCSVPRREFRGRWGRVLFFDEGPFIFDLGRITSTNCTAAALVRLDPWLIVEGCAFLRVTAASFLGPYAGASGDNDHAISVAVCRGPDEATSLTQVETVHLVWRRDIQIRRTHLAQQLVAYVARSIVDTGLIPVNIDHGSDFFGSRIFPRLLRIARADMPDVVVPELN